MIKLTFATRRRPGMTHAEFTAYNIDVHGTIVRGHPVQIRRYLQHDVFDGGFGSSKGSEYSVDVGRDNVTELFFDDLAGLIATATDQKTREQQLQDGDNYVDTKTAIAMVATEIELDVDRRGGGRLKVHHFLRPSEAVAESDFAPQWRSAFERAVRNSGITDHLRRAVLSASAPEGKPIIDAMGAKPDYQAYSTFWFDREDSGAVHFRAYIDALEADADCPVDHARSFFLLAREQELFDRR